MSRVTEAGMEEGAREEIPGVERETHWYTRREAGVVMDVHPSCLASGHRGKVAERSRPPSRLLVPPYRTNG